MELDGWSNDVEKVLRKIGLNAVRYSENHKSKYFWYKSLEKYFRIPTIILSALGSVSSVGLSAYLSRENVAVLTCSLSLTVGIINSIELFLQIQENLELELKNAKDFYTLAVDIKKVLHLNREHRGINGINYLESKYNTYIKLIEGGNLVGKMEDLLIIDTEINPNIKKSSSIKNRRFSMKINKNNETNIFSPQYESDMSLFLKSQDTDNETDTIISINSDTNNEDDVKQVMTENENDNSNIKIIKNAELNTNNVIDDTSNNILYNTNPLIDLDTPPNKKTLDNL
jgi:hypothetical protein